MARCFVSKMKWKILLGANVGEKQVVNVIPTYADEKNLLEIKQWIKIYFWLQTFRLWHTTPREKSSDKSLGLWPLG